MLSQTVELFSFFVVF